MGRLTRGVLIILFVLVVGVLNAFIQTGAAATEGFEQSCTGNATNCSNDAQNQADFFDTLFSAEVAELPSAPPIVNILFLLVMVTLLSLGVLEAIFGVLPFYSE